MKSLLSTLGLSLLVLLPQGQPAAAKKCPAYWLETAQGPLKALDNEAPKERNLNPGRKRCGTFVVRHRVVERPTGGYPKEFPCPEPDACEFSRQQVSVRPLKSGVQITSITADEGTRLREAGEEGYVWTVPASTLEAEGEEVYQLRVCIKGRLGQEDWADLLEPNLDAAISATQPCPWSIVA